MNLNDLYEMRDRRDAYQRDHDNSVSGMGRGRDHRGLGQELAHERNNIQIAINGRPWKVVAGKGTADSAEESSNLESMKQWAERKSASSGKKWTVYLTGAEVSESQGMAEAKKKAVPSNQRDPGALATRQHIAGQEQKHRDWAQKQKELESEFYANHPELDDRKGVAEGSQQVDSLVTDALKIMQGATMNDAVAALKTVLGNREYNDRRGHYSFYVRQLMDMYGQQGKVESELNEFLDPQAVAQDPGLEREPTADVVVFGRMPQDFTFDKVVQALEAVLPREYPPGSSPSQQGMPDSPAELKGSEIAKNNGAVVTTKPLSTAQKVVKEFQARGIKCKLIAKPGMNESEVDSDGHSVDHADSGEYDYEGDQARDQMNTIVRAARRLDGLLDDNENMPEWVQMKVTLAADYLDTAADYIESNQEPELEEGWKEKLGAAALAGTMALGAAGANARVTPDGQGGFTGGLKPTTTQQATDTAPARTDAPAGFSKEYLQKAADPNRTGRYLISVEKAQELLKQMNEG
jgi:hypothetical protein